MKPHIKSSYFVPSRTCLSQGTMAPRRSDEASLNSQVYFERDTVRGSAKHRDKGAAKNTGRGERGKSTPRHGQSEGSCLIQWPLRTPAAASSSKQQPASTRGGAVPKSCHTLFAGPLYPLTSFPSTDGQRSKRYKEVIEPHSRPRWANLRSNLEGHQQSETHTHFGPASRTKNQFQHHKVLPS